MILVTGGTGFIGKRLINGILSSGSECVLVSRRPVKGFKTITCDLVKEQLTPNDLIDVDSIFHLAGFAHDLSNNDKNEHLYQALNVDATVSLVELAGVSGVKSFVFVSSVKAGGSYDDGQCATEKDQVNPEGIYGRTKREAELKVLEIGRKYKMHVSIVRPSLVYGPGVKGNLKLMIMGIKGGWLPPLPEIGNRRSMIHVDDLVNALLLVVDSKNANGEIFIATDGHPYSTRQIYETICNLQGKSIPHWNIPYFFFHILSFMSSRFRYKVNKLFGNEYYSSNKLRSIGFKVKRSLGEMNETRF